MISIIIIKPSYFGVAVVSGFVHVRPIQYYGTSFIAVVAEMAAAAVTWEVKTQNKLDFDVVHAFAFSPSMYNGTAGVFTTMLIFM